MLIKRKRIASTNPTLITKESFSTSDYPSCPITGMRMIDPVQVGTNPNDVYERTAIKAWLKTNKTSPLTRQAFHRNEANRIVLVNQPKKSIKKTLTIIGRGILDTINDFLDHKDPKAAEDFVLNTLELPRMTAEALFEDDLREELVTRSTYMFRLFETVKKIDIQLNRNPNDKASLYSLKDTYINANPKLRHEARINKQKALMRNLSQHYSYLSEEHLHTPIAMLRLTKDDKDLLIASLPDLFLEQDERIDSFLHIATQYWFDGDFESAKAVLALFNDADKRLCRAEYSEDIGRQAFYIDQTVLNGFETFTDLIDEANLCEKTALYHKAQYLHKLVYLLARGLAIGMPIVILFIMKNVLIPNLFSLHETSAT